jgi:(S)-2-hydroxy-acid oxidase
VTADTAAFGRRETDIRNHFAPPQHLTLGNFENFDPSISSGLNTFKGSGSSLSRYAATLMSSSLNWEDIAWLRTLTTLKIVVKGIMTVEDALLCLHHGVDGIWVSNHGGRQLDTVPATIDVLPDILRAVDGAAEIYMDGGVTRGTDVLKVSTLFDRF